ncbi:hypothetical protein H4R99_006947 [Coemansia sp. RSA 1722]|nr:hypothetical protein LPJ57_003652 [Coemansia sp. RSA 486]KAJ2590893.1 hypothetical protein H4R99_006947 [Coemansia sp. RSA 1722]
MFERVIMDKDIISHIISDDIIFNGTVFDRSIFNRIGLDESASSNMFALVKTAPVYAPTNELAVERHYISKINEILEVAQASTLDAIKTIDTMKGEDRLFKAIFLVDRIVNDAIRIFDNADRRAAVAAAMQLANNVHAPVTHAVSTFWSLDKAFFGAAQITQILAAAVSRYIPGLPVDIAASAITKLVKMMISLAVRMVDRLNASDVEPVAVCLIRATAAKAMPLVMGLPEDTRGCVAVGLARALYSQLIGLANRVPSEYLYSKSPFLLKEIVSLTVCKVYSMSVVDAAALVLDVAERQAAAAVERLIVEIEASNASVVDECVVAPTDLVVEHRDSATALKEENENLMTGLVAPANTAEDLGVNPRFSAGYGVNSDGASTSAAAAASKPCDRVSRTTPIEACKEPTDGAEIPEIKYKKTRRSPKRSKKNKNKGKEVEQLDTEK